MDLNIETLKTRRTKEYRTESTRTGFSLETMVVRRQWDDIVKVLKEKTYQLRILCQVKLSFTNKGERNTSPDEQEMKEYVARTPTLKRY